ncbi:hypothetical protein ASE11_07120 [Hydrogenophaga sp. Root209]|uniref:YciI family protein n=1 Tax=Hydrogenophaga sp. Root209 TaxID=1736490 RepID=UPI0006F814C6|nr:YciI family protein [Hydrogenophaga sp. Root209]KRB99487.1 hypothetical protein ASE11_07120 [Hydrogenophaga sp. Root209]
MDLTPIAQDMLRAMLNKPLFVALRNPADLTKSAALLEAHLEWAVAAERRGELFASGPFIAEGAPPGSLGGMTIVRAASLAEARKILEQDPFVREGVVSIDLRKWSLMEGGITLSMRFSDQTARLM